MITLENFCKTYNSRNNSFTVDNINLQVKNGQIAGLLGPNGSGKTTILKAICGFHYGDSGKVLIDSIDAFENPEKIPDKLGYVPEISILPGEYTVRNFLLYCASIHNIKDVKSALQSVCKTCGIQKVLDKKIKTLSKGYQQRVSFAQALIHNPENLVLDEPVSGLDPSQILQMRSLIKKLSETKAILMSTHLLQEVYSLCTEIYIMNNGKLMASGTEEEIIKNAGVNSLEEAFVYFTKDETGDDDE